jgi:hypothetical protein
MEGTAKYVEVRCAGLMGDLCRETAAGTPPSACDVFGPVTPEAYLLADFEDRLKDGVIEPSEMPRNRMYPVASATAVLLDYFGVDWKTRASDPATSPGLAEMLGEGLGIKVAQTESLMVRAVRQYDYDDMRSRCDLQSVEYPLAYRAAVDSMAGLPGFHIAVEAPVSGLSRSRSCSGKRWTLESPQRSFSKSCQAYALKSLSTDDLFVEIHDSGIAEETSADGRTRSVLFVAPDVLVAEIDGQPVDLGANATYQFTALTISGSSFSVRYDGEGSLSIEGTHITARLHGGGPLR